MAARARSGNPTNGWGAPHPRLTATVGADGGAYASSARSRAAASFTWVMRVCDPVG
jgi:hypothetical protein